MVVVDVVLVVAVAVADGDHSGHGNDHGQVYDILQLPRDSSSNRSRLGIVGIDRERAS